MVTVQCHHSLDLYQLAFQCKAELSLLLHLCTYILMELWLSIIFSGLVPFFILMSKCPRFGQQKDDSWVLLADLHLFFSTSLFSDTTRCSRPSRTFPASVLKSATFSKKTQSFLVENGIQEPRSEHQVLYIYFKSLVFYLGGRKAEATPLSTRYFLLEVFVYGQ